MLSSAAAAAGDGTTAGYISGIPAMYRLGLLTDVRGDLLRLFLWSLSAAVYGAFFAIPFRKYFIIKRSLPFPSPTAAAEIIKSLHATGGAEAASKKTKCMLYCLIFSLAYCIAGFFLKVLKEWHIFYWLGELFKSDALLEADGWNWYFQLTFAFLGAGMMTPMNTAVSVVSGSVIAWGILGPLLLHYGVVRGAFYLNAELEKGPSARFWLLWPGIFMMVAASFTELGTRWRMLWGGVSGLFSNLGSCIEVRKRRPSQQPLHPDGPVGSAENEDPVPEEYQVPKSWWLTGLIVSAIFTVILLNVGFNVAYYESIFAILLGIFFGFIAIESSAQTDINPTGTIAKTSQVIFSVLDIQDVKQKQTVNLVSGLVSSAIASQSSSMVSDLKTANLVGAAPRAQFVSQIIGALFSSVIGLGFWYLFATAYPCILNTDLDDECRTKYNFGLQAVTAWYGITLALAGQAKIPVSSLISSVCIGLLTVIFVIVKNKYISEKYHPYLPNINAIGIAFINPDSSLMIALLAGALAAKMWQQYRPESCDFYMFSAASGFIAGEGIYGLVSAAFVIAGLGEYVLEWGCPT